MVITRENHIYALIRRIQHQITTVEVVILEGRKLLLMSDLDFLRMVIMVADVLNPTGPKAPIWTVDQMVFRDPTATTIMQIMQDQAMDIILTELDILEQRQNRISTILKVFTPCQATSNPTKQLRRPQEVVVRQIPQAIQPILAVRTVLLIALRPNLKRILAKCMDLMALAVILSIHCLGVVLMNSMLQMERNDKEMVTQIKLHPLFHERNLQDPEYLLSLARQEMPG